MHTFMDTWNATEYCYVMSHLVVDDVTITSCISTKVSSDVHTHTETLVDQLFSKSHCYTFASYGNEAETIKISKSVFSIG